LAQLPAARIDNASLTRHRLGGAVFFSCAFLRSSITEQPQIIGWFEHSPGLQSWVPRRGA